MIMDKRLRVYDELRSAHSIIKDIIYSDGYDEWEDIDKLPIEAVHSVLYLAESRFTDESIPL